MTKQQPLKITPNDQNMVDDQKLVLLNTVQLCFSYYSMHCFTYVILIISIVQPVLLLFWTSIFVLHSSLCNTVNKTNCHTLVIYMRMHLHVSVQIYIIWNISNEHRVIQLSLTDVNLRAHNRVQTSAKVTPFGIFPKITAVIFYHTANIPSNFIKLCL